MEQKVSASKNEIESVRNINSRSTRVTAYRLELLELSFSGLIVDTLDR